MSEAKDLEKYLVLLFTQAYYMSWVDSDLLGPPLDAGCEATSTYIL